MEHSRNGLRPSFCTDAIRDGFQPFGQLLPRSRGQRRDFLRSDRLEQVIGVPHFSSPGRSHGPMVAPWWPRFDRQSRQLPGTTGTPKAKNPSRINDLGFFLGRPGTRLHVLDHHLTKSRARNLGRAFHQARKVVGDFLAGNRALHRGQVELHRQ